MSSKDGEYDVSPGAKLDFGFNWLAKGWLAADETILTSVWDAEAPLVKGVEQNASGITLVFLEGFELGMIYTVTNTITTALLVSPTVAHRTDSRTLTLSCKRR